jgi:membrane protein required for colicin V production
MNWLDIAIIVVLGISILSGLKVGIIRAVVSLVGLAVGVVLSGRFYVQLAERLTFIHQENLARIAAFAIILIGVMLIAGIVASLLKWTVSAIMLGWVDHLIGAVFGLIMGGLFTGAILAIWVNLLGASGPIAESGLAKFLLDKFPLVLALLPDEFSKVRPFFQ